MNDPRRDHLSIFCHFSKILGFGEKFQKLLIFQIPFFIVQVIQATVSLTRINNFLNAGEIDSEAIGKKPKDVKNAVEASNVTFTWDDNLLIPTLNKIDLSVKKGSCVAIVGQVCKIY